MPHAPVHATTLAAQQGYVKAAEYLGSIYFWGQGVVIDLPRAMVAYTVGAKGGDTSCQHQIGCMFMEGLGVEADLKQAMAWLEKAAAQGLPDAFGMIGYLHGMGGESLTPSVYRARYYLARAVKLGHVESGDSLKILHNVAVSIQKVSGPAYQSHPISIMHANLAPPPPPPLPRTSSTLPSWTSGWRSTERAARI